LDEEGYLYLTDRKSFMIITGGVNVYPQEIENLLVTHPRIADAAVLGAPDEDLGEVVVAVVQTLDPRDAGEAFARDLRTWMRQSLSGVKVPKHIIFRAALPRLPTGKMAKHVLRRELAESGLA
jgi:acyl-CoA synthetase (AMP-forming)/AMP-acid ligase II